MNELKTICNKFNISYNIYIEKNNKIIKTSEIDNKITIIKNIRKFFKYEKIPSKTIYKNKIIKFEKLDSINENNYIYYYQYSTTNKNILELMKKLTNNKFKFGAISQKIIREIWRKNKLITYKEFASLWINEYNNNLQGINYPELAYNQFMKNNGNIKEWFENKQNILTIFKKYNLL
jgi:transposase-like protein